MQFVQIHTKEYGVVHVNPMHIVRFYEGGSTKKELFLQIEPPIEHNKLVTVQNMTLQDLVSAVNHAVR